ncbi:hypothetical protein M0812_23970 [Anaeramoeba flamelloides]|uniref:Uncharacterized protein n=1 Tax=Anaeramoeba flamelloides TaxID=1746091 RepID=A0AAV7YKZ5_9EUKA|nr:hypothetical protein M0812_23970 [Anaeramoeba flamelloides]
MKITSFVIGILLVSLVLCSCKTDKDCTDKKEPRCYNEKCRQCNINNDCSLDEYCDTTKDNYECTKYSDDDILGSFCNGDGCKNKDNSKVCAKCDGNSTIWEGVCINFKCEVCKISGSGAYDPASTSIVESHSEGMCFPKGVSGVAGKIAKYQKTDGTPNFVLQDAQAISWIAFGLVCFFFLIVQCLTFFRLAKK